MKSILYARLSVNRSGETLAIDRQLQDCRELAERNGWEVVGTYTDDNRSAWHDQVKRPGYDALREAIKRRECDVVVVYETDRLARRLRTMLDLFDLLLETGVRVHSVKSGMISLDSPMNIANAQMKAVFAEQYVNDARDKNLRSRLQAAQSGKRHLTRRPYGWEADGQTVRESEAAVVREIVDRLILGHTGTRIARELNQRGIRTGLGALWTGVGVKACAKRASNAGLRSHKGMIYDGTWPALVSREDWEAACRVIERPQSAYKRGKGRKYPFTGFVVCGLCGEPLSVATGRSNSGHVAYRCDGRKRGELVGKVGCGGVQRAQVPVDYLIKEALIDRLDGEGLRQELAKTSGSTADAQSVIDELHRVTQRRDGLVDDYAAGLLNRDEFARAKQSAEIRLTQLDKRLAGLSTGNVLSRADFSSGIRHVIETADLYLLRDLAELLIERVVIMPQAKAGFQVRTLDIEGRRYRFDPALVLLVWRR